MNITGDAELSEQLHELPDKIADSLLVWRRATINRQNQEAREFIKAKMSALENKRPAGDDFIKSLVRSSDVWVSLMDSEAAAESNYVRLYERHLSNKKTAGIRTAY
jgi:asparagine synthetase A